MAVQLKEKALFPIAGGRTDKGIKNCFRAALGAKLHLHTRWAGAFPRGKNLFGGGIVVFRQNRNQRRGITFEHGAEKLEGSLVDLANNATGLDHERGPPGVFQDESEFRL